jgi:hypothetical protein
MAAEENARFVPVDLLARAITIQLECFVQRSHTLLITPGKEDTVVSKKQMGYGRTLTTISYPFQQPHFFLYTK